MEDLRKGTEVSRMTQNVQDDSRSRAEAELPKEQLEQVNGGAIDAFIWFENSSNSKVLGETKD